MKKKEPQSRGREQRALHPNQGYESPERSPINGAGSARRLVSFVLAADAHEKVVPIAATTADPSVDMPSPYYNNHRTRRGRARFRERDVTAACRAIGKAGLEIVSVTIDEAGRITVTTATKDADARKDLRGLL